MGDYKFSWKKIIGNSETVANLKKFSVEKTFPHAVLFAGVEGIGKRKVAETCAATLLCENLIDGEPCGTCDSCKLMAAGTHPDFYVVEPEDTKAARNIKIGQIRDLQREASLRPVQSDRRVVIIDGAEFMNKAAANCILKTLEEPPTQTIFILLTANRAGLLLTIRSRCSMTLSFEKLSAEQIYESLLVQGIDAVKAQKLSVIADGSLGRALALEKSGGYEMRDDAFNLIKQISSKALTDEIIFAKGKIWETWSRENFADFVTYIQKILRDIYLLNQSEVYELYNVDLKENLAAIKIPEKILYKMIAEGTLAQRRLKSNANLRLLAESYLMRLRLTCK
ncbi:MAG: DNA polymerase III subunit delta' [Selenomonadaceae bacterium]|nr:DNA polymerase III subunit delta' [Selenomonadaceae bacterium]